VPSVQRGDVRRRLGRAWEARWYDEARVRRTRGGFETKTAARQFLEMKTEEVAALRRGDLPLLASKGSRSPTRSTATSRATTSTRRRSTS
jgi:hypothetical protein